MVSHWQESTTEFGQAVDSRFRHFASCFGYYKKTWNRAKTIFGAPSILPPPKKIHFLPRTRDFSRKRVCGFSIWRLQENVFNSANLFGGAIFMFPPFNPPNPVSSRRKDRAGTPPPRSTWCYVAAVNDSHPQKPMEEPRKPVHATWATSICAC